MMVMEEEENEPIDEAKIEPPKITIKEKKEIPISKKSIKDQILMGFDNLETLAIQNNMGNYKKILAEVRRLKRIAEDL